MVRRSPQETLLLAAVTAAPDQEGAHATAMEQVAAAALAQPAVAGFHWLLNDTLTDISFGAPVRHWGAELLSMQVGARALAIGPNTFFQNNLHLLLPLLDDVRSVVSRRYAVAGTADLDEYLSDSAAPTADGRLPAAVADLYGGVGTIALHLADAVGQVTCVESFEESAQLAERNIAASGARNVAVVASDVLAFLRDQPPGRFGVVVADPPRTGLGPEVCRELLRLRPRRLVYVSCNALSQLEDARGLAAGYRVAELRGYDMFPQTPHLEALAILERA